MIAKTQHIEVMFYALINFILSYPKWKNVLFLRLGSFFSQAFKFNVYTIFTTWNWEWVLVDVPHFHHQYDNLLVKAAVIFQSLRSKMGYWGIFFRSRTVSLRKTNLSGWKLRVEYSIMFSKTNPKIRFDKLDDKKSFP